MRLSESRHLGSNPSPAACMLNKDEINVAANAAAEIVKATPIYQDAVQPVAQEIGKALKTLGGAINVALMPIASMVYGFDLIKENLKKRLEKRLSSTPPENIVVPKLQVIGPLLEKYKYIYDNEDLSQMFINLLANAMDKEQIQKAHPSFVNVISELSPDEARLIETIAKENALPKLDIKKQSTLPENKDKGYIYIFVNFTLLGEKAKLQYPDLTPSYLSNLERLNIISCPIDKGESYTNREYYKILEEHQFINTLRQEAIKNGDEIKTIQGVIEITDFGKLFIDAVQN